MLRQPVYRRLASDEDTCDLECSSVDPAIYRFVGSGAEKIAADSLGGSAKVVCTENFYLDISDFSLVTTPVSYRDALSHAGDTSVKFMI